MKRITAAALCLCLLLAGCVQAAPQITEPEILIDLQLHPKEHAVNDGSGTPIFTLTCPEPTLTHPDAAVRDAILLDLNTRIDQWTAEAETLENAAINADSGQLPWYLSLEGSVTRADRDVVSLLFTLAKYTGGNHPSIQTISVNYDSKTGKALQLSDILKDGCDESELAVEVNRVLAVYAEDLFDDYESIVGQQFVGGNVENWYLTDSALCFHFAPYAIGPYATGTITAELPYSSISHLLP